MPNNQLKIKTEALEFERENYQYLQFVDSTDGFKQIYDHSALIFKVKIAEKIGYKTANLRQDNALQNPKAKYGVISFKNFENLRLKLIGIGATEEKTLKNPRRAYFKLPRKYSKQEIETIIKELANKKQKLQQIIAPKNPEPMLMIRLENLEKMLYENLRQTHTFAQKTIGARIFNLSAEALKTYLYYANFENKNTERAKIQAILREIRYNLKTVENLSLIRAENLEKILEEIVILERILGAKK